MLGNPKSNDLILIKLITSVFSILLLVGCATAVFEPETNNQPVSTKQPSSWPAATVAVFNQGVQSLGSDNESARVKFAEAIELSPTMEPAYYNLAKLDFDQKNFEGVDGFLEQTQQNNVSSARLNNLFATSKRLQYDFEAAEKFYLSAIQMDPTYTPSLLNLAILYDVYQGKIAEAEKYYLLYQQQLELKGQQDNRIKNWITDIQRRKTSKTGGGR